METYINERPTELSEEQEIEFCQRLAKEVVANRWSESHIEAIVHDLKSLFVFENGYQMAKELEGIYSLGSYDIDTPFIEWLDDLFSKYDDETNNNVKRWVKENDIKPLYRIGTQLKVIEGSTFRLFEKPIFINGYLENTAKYLVSNEKGSKRNIVLDYEYIENNCVDTSKCQ